MQQQTFAEVTFEPYRKPTRRERFLDEMARMIPWGDLAGVIAPFYPKARLRKRGRESFLDKRKNEGQVL